MHTPKLTTWDPATPEQAMTLPSRFYYDPEIFRQEVHSILYTTWHCVCHDSELPDTGSFVTFDMMDQGIILVRGEDGAVRAFHNACQHRGTRLLDDRRGNVGRHVVCPYHRWSYKLDGVLRVAPRTENVPGFDKARHPLKPVRVETFAGFHFINFDLNATPLAADVPGALEAMRPFFKDLDDITFHAEVDYMVNANWKTIIDNEIEGYHFNLSGPHHVELAALIDFNGYTMTPHGKWWDFKGPPKPVETAFGHRVAGANYQTEWFYNITLWPVTTLYTFPYADVIGTFNKIPLGPEKTLLRFGHYVPKSHPQGALSKASIDWFNTKLGPEDIELNERQQRGLRSFGFDQGRYVIDAERSANSEHLVHHFHTLVHQALNPPGPMRTAAE